MKKSFHPNLVCLIFVPVFLFVLNAVSIAQSVTEQYINEMIMEKGEKQKQTREQWINEMHKIEEGIDWRLIERINQEIAVRKREIALKDRFSSIDLKSDLKQRIQSDGELVADGRIIGKWIEKGSNNLAGRIMTCDYDPETETIYAISAGGNIWKGTERDTAWVSLNDGNRFAEKYIKVVKISNNKKRIIAVSGKSVFFSDDDGMNWVEAKGLEEYSKWGWIKKAQYADGEKNLLWVIGGEWDWEKWKAIASVYYSEDYGTTFMKYSTYDVNVDLIDIWAPQYHNKGLYFMLGDTVKIISNPAESGSEIINIATFPDKNVANGLMLTGFRDAVSTRLFIVKRMYSKSNELFYYSDDDGKNWFHTDTIKNGPFTHNSFRASITDKNVIYFGTNELFKSKDMGKNWKLVNGWGEYYANMKYKLHADIPSIDVYFDKNGNEKTFISTDGGLYVSYDQCDSVTNISMKNLNVSQYYTVLTNRRNPKIIYAGSQDQGFQRCLNDSGKTLSFAQTISGDYGHISSSDNGKSLWTVYPGFAMYYKNAEQPNMGTYFWTFEGQGWQWMPQILAKPFEPTTAYCAAGGQNGSSHLWLVKYELDKIKATMLPYDFHDSLDSKLISFGISELDDTFYALTNNGQFYKSSDYGYEWEKNDAFAGPGGHYFYGSNVMPSKVDENTVYLAGSGYSNPPVFVSNDKGVNFREMSNGLPNTLVYDIVANHDESLLFAATEVGPYVYIKSEDAWFSMSGVAAPMQTYWAVDYVESEKIARFATHGRGIWDFKIDKLVSVNESGSDATPEPDIRVSPNPATKNVTISVLSSIGAYELRIYDTQAKLVRQFSGNNAGNSEIKWDLTAASGYPLDNGIYQIILISNGQLAFTKFIINK